MGRFEFGCLLPVHYVTDSLLDVLCHLIIILALQMRTEAQRAPEAIPLSEKEKGEKEGGSRSEKWVKPAKERGSHSQPGYSLGIPPGRNPVAL